MSRPRAVVFGLGGTLVAAPDDPGHAIAARLGLDADAARRISVLAHGAPFEAPAALAARLRDELGLSADPTAAVEAVWRAQSVEPGVLAGAPASVGAVHAAGARVAIVADAWTPFGDAARTACVPFATRIDRWFLSADAGAPARDGTLLAAALQALDVPPAHVLVVGADVERELRPALALGASAVWLRHEAGGDGAVAIDPHGAPNASAAVPVPASAIVARTHAAVRRIALTWLWASRGPRVGLTTPLPD